MKLLRGVDVTEFGLDDCIKKNQEDRFRYFVFASIDKKSIEKINDESIWHFTFKTLTYQIISEFIICPRGICMLRLIYATNK